MQAKAMHPRLRKVSSSCNQLAKPPRTGTTSRARGTASSQKTSNSIACRNTGSSRTKQLHCFYWASVNTASCIAPMAFSQWQSGIITKWLHSVVQADDFMSEWDALESARSLAFLKSTAMTLSKQTFGGFVSIAPMVTTQTFLQFEVTG